MIPTDKTNIPTHFSSLYSALLCKQMEMYGQGKYIVTRKNKNKKEMYNLTLIVPLLYFLSLSLSLSLSHFECYIRISQIEDSSQS